MTTTRLYVLLAACSMIVGCSSLTRHSDPLAGWHFSSLNNLDSNKAVSDDYHAYIDTLSPKERKSLGVTKYFEDGTGQHAVKIEIGLNGTWWQHVLIYNTNNNRIKAMKYSSGGYRS